MRLMRSLSGSLWAVAVALLTSTALAGAQPLPGNFTSISQVYAFDGCAAGPVAFPLGANQGTPFCVRGRFVTGIGPQWDGQLVVMSALDYFPYDVDPRLAGGPWVPGFSSISAAVNGFLTSPSCPVGCAHGVAFGRGGLGLGGGLVPTPVIPFGSPDLSLVFDARSIYTTLSYSLMDPNSPIGPFYSEFTPFATFALTAVPEPSTYALFGTGLLALGGVAARRKRTS